MDRLAVGHPALGRALEAVATVTPVLAARAGAALEILLEGVTGSRWQEVAWAFSRLTGDGFPIEFTCSTRDATVRYTTEVAGPEVDPRERLPLAERQLARLGARELSAALGARLRAIQGAGALLYGAWIGGRHGPDGDQYKLYVEVPRGWSDEIEDLVRPLMGEAPLLPAEIVQLRMIGYEPATERMELYFRVDRMDAWQLGLLLQRAGLAEQHAALLGLIEDAYGRSVEPVLPGSKLGLSFAYAPAGRPAALSVFALARTLCGGDDGIRRRLLALGARHGWDLRSYARLSEPLIGRTGRKTAHGMVAFFAPREGPVGLHIGLRPPEVVT
jgi:hypothetical protein